MSLANAQKVINQAKAMGAKITQIGPGNNGKPISIGGQSGAPITEDELKKLQKEFDKETKPMLKRMKEIMEQDELSDEDKEEFKSLQKKYNDLAEEMDTKANYKKYADRLTTCARLGYAPTMDDSTEMFSILIKEDENLVTKTYLESNPGSWSYNYVATMVDSGNHQSLVDPGSWPGDKIQHTLEKWPTTKQHSQYLYVLDEESWYFKDECKDKPKWVRLKKPIPKVDQAKFDFI